MSRTSSIMIKTVLGLGLLTTVACGGSTSSGSSDDGTDDAAAPQFTTIDDLPRATSPVVEDASSSISALTSPRFATTGITLSDLGGEDFTTNSSLAMCEASQTLKSAFQEAVQGDLILCYIQNSVATAATDQSIDIYDGEAHIFDLTFDDSFEEEEDPSGGDTFRIKLQITKNDAGVITDFKMHACDAEVQSEYLHQSIDSSAFSMTSIFTFDEDEGGSGGQEMNVTGTLNSDGEFTSKTITSNYSHDWSDGGSGYGSKTVVLGADSATISQWDTGEWVWSDGEFSDTGSYSNRVYALAEILNQTLGIQDIAIGDGAASGISGGTCCGGEEYTEEYEEGWDGDLTVTDDTILDAYLEDLAAGSIPEVGSAPTIAFTGDAAFDDCSADAEAIGAVEVSLGGGEEVMNACSDLEMSWSWVNCYDIVKNGNLVEEEGDQDQGGDDQDQGGDEDFDVTCETDCSQAGEFEEECLAMQVELGC